MVPPASSLERLAGRSVAVTGAAGFIGAHLCASLVRAGARVVAIDSDLGWRPGFRRLVDDGRAEWFAAGPWPYEDVAELSERLRGCDSIVHLAFRPPSGGVVVDHLRNAIDAEVGGLLDLLGALSPSVRHFCFASSAKVYDGSSPEPASESDAPQPATGYGLAKLASEHATRISCEALGVVSTVLRLSTVYGPLELVPRAVPNFIRHALERRPLEVRGPSDHRDYVYVGDVALAIVGALAAGSAADGTFNIGTGVATPTDELAAQVLDQVGVVVPVHRMDLDRPAEHGVVDVERARRAFGFDAATTLNDGLRSEVEWFRAWHDAPSNATASPRRREMPQ